MHSRGGRVYTVLGVGSARLWGSGVHSRGGRCARFMTCTHSRRLKIVGVGCAPSSAA